MTTAPHGTTTDAGAMVPTRAPVPPAVTHPKKRRRRRPTRRNWLRTREVEHSQLYNLQLDINDLRMEIQRLDALRTLLSSRTLQRGDARDGSCLRMVREYFEVVRNGYQDQVTLRGSGRTIRTAEFMAAFMDIDSRMGRLTGLEQFIRMSQRYTAVCGPISHRLEFVDVLAAASPTSRRVVITARTTFDTTILPSTLENILPRVRQRPDLERRMLGQSLYGDGHFEIVFDGASDETTGSVPRVVEFHMHLDFVPCVLALLGDPMDAAWVLEGALVSPESCIGDLSSFTLLEDEPHGRPSSSSRPDDVTLTSSSSPLAASTTTRPHDTLARPLASALLHQQVDTSLSSSPSPSSQMEIAFLLNS